MTLERGALLHRRYRIVETLGQGGMGSVYRAVDENLGVDVAVKENLFTTDEYARQFRLEAVILANLRHPNLPRVTDHFVIGDEGQYLVMDYIEGEDLRQRMERIGNIAEDEAILIGAAMCDALSYLHTRKPPILHRDIKPGNVKIAPDGHIYLVDFGLAKVLHGSQVTTTGARAMTPGYSPPEQYGTARTDLRTDIYSLGATLYAALTGVIPEDGLARAMDNTQLTPLRKRNPRVSRRLAAAVEKAMGVDPADRFQDAEEFKRALLGSKSKTQRLPGEYTIPPPPKEAIEAHKQALLEKNGQNVPSGPGGIVPPSSEPPPFKPPRKKRGARGCLTYLLLFLLLLAGGLVGLVRFRPEMIPPDVMSLLPSLLPFPIQTFMPLPTATQFASQTPTATEPVASLSPTPTRTPVTPTIAVSPTLRFTSTPEITLTPSPTPMGGGFGQIAFASSRTGVPQIYLVNIDGSGLTPLTSMENGACQPTWSPDGSRLAFISPCRSRGQFYEKTYRDSSLYVVNADGTNLIPLTTAAGSDFDPAWSPDGKRIGFTSLRDGHREIYVLELDTLTVTRLTTADSDDKENLQPSWSPFGNQIVYVAKRLDAYQVWTMTDSGQGNAQLVRSGQDLWDFLPVWSPDGEYILFSQRRVNVPSLPWLMSIRYTDRDSQQAARPDVGPSPIENVHFSPDEFWLVFEGQDSKGNNDIYYMTITGANRTRLTNDPDDDFDPAWRPITTP